MRGGGRERIVLTSVYGGQLVGLGFLLQPCGFQGLSSGLHTRQQVHLSAKPSY